jgi:hypothetical protein
MIRNCKYIQLKPIQTATRKYDTEFIIIIIIIIIIAIFFFFFFFLLP